MTLCLTCKKRAARGQTYPNLAYAHRGTEACRGGAPSDVLKLMADPAFHPRIVI